MMPLSNKARWGTTVCGARPARQRYPASVNSACCMKGISRTGDFHRCAWPASGNAPFHAGQLLNGLGKNYEQPDGK